MSHVHPDLYQAACNIRLQELRHQAAMWRLVRQTRKDRPGWLSRSACRLLGRLGDLLVRWGQRLEAHGAPQAVLEASGGTR